MLGSVCYPVSFRLYVASKSLQLKQTICYTKHLLFTTAKHQPNSVCTANTTTRTGLWKISGNKLEKPSYLFGTHHLAPLSFLDSIDGWEEAFIATQQTIGELDEQYGADANATHDRVAHARRIRLQHLLNDEDRNF